MGLSIDYVPTLKRLGLTEYEAKIYAAVVRAGSKTAGELSFLSGVPRTKLYGSLRSLEKKGLVRTVSRKPETFAANSPNESLLPLAESLVKEAGEGLENIQSLILAYESVKLMSSRRASPKIELVVLEGRLSVSDSLTKYLSGSNESVDIITSENGMVRLYKSHLKQVERLLSKGVKVRLITHVTNQNVSVAKEIRNILQLRPSPKLSFQIFCIDSKAIMFIEAIPDDQDDETGNDIGVISENPHIIDSFRNLYNVFWAALPSSVEFPKGASPTQR